MPTTRVNKYVAHATGMSRRAADRAVDEGRVKINSSVAKPGDSVLPDDSVSLDGKVVKPDAENRTIILNKPFGYVCSRNGQGSQTIYELLPEEYHDLKPVGRLDKDSTGLILLTNDGQLANQLTHPRYAKTKVYQVRLDKPLQPLHQQMIADHGIKLDDGPSKLSLQKIDDDSLTWQVTMSEGRNRQIRRTFDALGYTVVKLDRTGFGSYNLGNLEKGVFISVPTEV